MGFWHTLENEAKKLFGAVLGSNNKVQTAANDIRAIAPVVAGIIAIADPELAPFVVPVAQEVAADLVTVSAILQAAKVNPGTSKWQLIPQILDAVVSNLGALLTGGHIKNATLQAQIKAAADEVGIIKSILFPPAANA